MLFSKKWLQNHPQFLLHFLIHIDVLMLCRKFELIQTKIFGFIHTRTLYINLNTCTYMYLFNHYYLIIILSF